ncbi:MAG: hypothetical protein ABIH63_04065 [archaeon]
MDWFYVLVLTFATSSGLVCIYALISSYLLYTSVTRLSENDEFSKLVRALFLTVFIGFIYTLLNLVHQMGVIDLNKNVGVSILTNVLISMFFVMIAYLAFLTRQLSNKFGFRNVGQEVKQYLEESEKNTKKLVKKRKCR